MNRENVKADIEKQEDIKIGRDKGKKIERETEEGKSLEERETPEGEQTGLEKGLNREISKYLHFTTLFRGKLVEKIWKRVVGSKTFKEGKLKKGN